ncbi:MAG: hypothetical protein WDA47_03265 [Bacilli bacterium]|jgi:hypothetical protein
MSGKINLVELINGLAVIILAALIAWSRWRERRLEKRFGLKNNPERCAANEQRLKGLEEKYLNLESSNHQDHEKIFNSLDDMRQRLARVETKINGWKN